MPDLTTNACPLPQPVASAIPHPDACAVPQLPSLRWEWRTFDYQPERWAHLLHQVELLPSPAPAEEVWFLTPASPDIVKITHGRIEARRLLRTSASGLELWQPSLTADFPLQSDTVMALCDAWRCDRPARAPTVLDAAALLGWIDRALPQVRVLPVRKLRRRFRLLHCEGEWVTFETEAGQLESLSLEHHDPAIVHGALVALRLNGARNINCVDGLKRLLGWQLDAAHCVPAGCV